MKPTKYRQVLRMHLFAILGFSIICGCSGVGAKKIERPQVPSDFPFAVVWLQPNETTMSLNALTQRELLGLVMVKKWNEGDHEFVGVSIHDGKFYLHYPNVVYVKWEATERPDGSITKHAAVVFGPGGDSLITDQVKAGRLPPGVQVLDMDASGIDPYKYLSNATIQPKQ